MKLILHLDDNASDDLKRGKRVKIEATVDVVGMRPVYSTEGQFLFHEKFAELRLDLIDHLEETATA